LRVTGEHRVEVHLLDHQAAVVDAPARHGLEPFEQRRGVGAAMCFDEAEDDVDAAAAQRVCFLEHAIGLSHPGGGPDVDLQSPALGALDDLEKVLRPGPRLHGSRA
jgi:hypothetical protein